MALSLAAGNLVWQTVKQALTNKNPAIQGQFKALKEYLVSQVHNPDLQFIPFSDAQLTQATGYSPIAVPCTLYAVYFIKNGTTGTGTATDSWLTIANDASNVTDATKFVALMTSVAGQQVAAVYPGGLIFGTDITLSGETSAQDGTESTAGDSGSGFIIVGAV
jgi:hypothetical protein